MHDEEYTPTAEGRQMALSCRGGEGAQVVEHDEASLCYCRTQSLYSDLAVERTQQMLAGAYSIRHHVLLLASPPFKLWLTKVTAMVIALLMVFFCVLHVN